MQLYDPDILSNLLDSDFEESFDKLNDVIATMLSKNDFNWIHGSDFETFLGICEFILDKKKELSLPWQHLEDRIDREIISNVQKEINRNAHLYL